MMELNKKESCLILPAGDMNVYFFTIHSVAGETFQSKPLHFINARGNVTSGCIICGFVPINLVGVEIYK